MKILITSPRAPIVLEWLSLLDKKDNELIICDSLRFPLVRFYKSKQSVRFVRVPAPRQDFPAYEKSMQDLIEKVDWVIPTCEDIFYLAKVRLKEREQQKLFLPNKSLLYGLHHKKQVYDLLPKDTAICFPHTAEVTSVAELDFSRLEQTVLKPVYSRFGRSVFKRPKEEQLKNLVISADYPWVQQEYVAGQALCSYAICDRGKVIGQVVYRPDYLVNDSASTYFIEVKEERIWDFVEKFVCETSYHGQVAFDFIDDGTNIFLIECNPRATSGLHLLAPRLAWKDRTWQEKPGDKRERATISKKVWWMFAWKNRRKKSLRQIKQDFQVARDALKNLPFHAFFLSMGEMIWLACIHHIALTDATTFDIEYNENNHDEFK